MSDEFEKLLRKQNLRQIPGEWREQFLNAARLEARKAAPKNADENNVTLWRLILSRFPVAWGALAALWILVVAINGFLLGSGGTTSDHQMVAATNEPLTVWRLRSAELQQLVSGKDAFFMEAPTLQPSEVLPRPRSERTGDQFWGDWDSAAHSRNFA